MGNSTSRVVNCLVPFGNGKDGIDLEFLEPLDEGLGHSFCYVRPVIADSPAITPSNSERFTIESSTFDSERYSGSFRQEIVDESCTQRTSKNFSETTFKTISGASVSANASTAQTGNPNILFLGDAQEPAASFESTSSFAAIPLQPAPHGSGPLNGFMSGPLERGFASGPLERGGGFTSGPLDKGPFMSGPLDSMDRSNFSAPLSYGQRRAGFGRLVRTVSRPVRSALSRTFIRHLSGPSLVKRFLLQPMSQFVWHPKPKDAKFRSEVPLHCTEVRPSENEYRNTCNLQWAHGKAGEDRVHVVLSEEQGWLFVGIYDGFSGPDAPDFLMSNLYKAIDKELEGLLWDYEDKAGSSVPSSGLLANDAVGNSDECVAAMQLSVDDAEKKCGDGAVSVVLNEVESRILCTIDKGPDVESAEPDEFAETKREIEDVAQIQEVTATFEVVNNNVSGRNIGNSRGPKNESVDSGVISDEKGEVKNVAQKQGATMTCEKGSANVNVRDTGKPSRLTNEELAPSIKISGKGRKTIRLYELLHMELTEEYDAKVSSSVSDIGNRRTDRCSSQPGIFEDLCSRQCLPGEQTASCLASMTQDCPLHMGDEVNLRENEGAAADEDKDKQKVISSYYAPEQKQMTKRSLIGSNMQKLYRKQKSIRRKLFPWSYDWHRDQTHIDEKVVDSSVVIRRCKSGPVDHDAVLKAMSRALETTEETYMNMVERTLDRNPELALMGSCVLVMLMKDQDVYVMNLGDSRVILAQERLNDWHVGPNVAKEDVKNWNRPRESLVRMELDRISEESPVQNQNSRVCKVSKNREIPIYRLKMKAVQLSADHSTSIEEEILRIKAEHVDDAQAVFNDRVKGQLKVTRAFGAGFLKKPKFNEALLEMFRINYIGTSPYLSCIPLVVHHRLSSNDRFLVLSSDGLYQYFTNEGVVSHVAWFMENVPEGDPAQYLITELLFRAAKKNGMDFHELLDIPHGDRRKYHDDVSVMVISLEGRIWRSSG
uniref:protein-serine/threonine phosphatase n=1 Tax=Anthurium amnicola TaxID=1678845 RepID=A0A1D1Y9X6_9ARAE